MFGHQPLPFWLQGLTVFLLDKFSLFLDLVHRLKLFKARIFGSWLCFHFQVETQIRPLRSSYCQWARIARSKGSTMLGVPLPEDGRISGFRNVVL